MKSVSDSGKSVLQLAKEEIAKERAVEAKNLLKDVLKKKASAQVILDNIEREIADLEEKIDQGNF